MYIVQNRTY